MVEGRKFVWFDNLTHLSDMPEAWLALGWQPFFGLEFSQRKVAFAVSDHWNHQSRSLKQIEQGIEA